MITAFNIEEDFYKDPIRNIIFTEEKENKVPSNIMWALFIFQHPSSDIYNFPNAEKKRIIKEDFLKSETFNVDNYSKTLKKIRMMLPKHTRMLIEWEAKLEEIDEFIDSKKISEDTVEMVMKIMKDKKSLWDQYHAIKKLVEQHNSTSVGDIEESLLEQGSI